MTTKLKWILRVTFPIIGLEIIRRAGHASLREFAEVLGFIIGIIACGIGLSCLIIWLYFEK